MKEDSHFPRFLAAFLLFFGAIVAVVWLWNIYMPDRFFRPEYSTWKAKLDLLKTDKEANVFIMGDSSPCADILPARMNSRVLNLAMGGTGPLETYYYTKFLDARPTPPVAIILSYAPSQMLRPYVFWDKSAAYGLINNQEVHEAWKISRELKDESLFGGMSPLDIDARLKMFLFSIKFPTYNGTFIMESFLKSTYKENQEQYKKTIEHRGQKYFGLNGGVEAEMFDKETQLKKFESSKLVDYYFDKTLEHFASRNIPVYFMCMPHSEVSDPHHSPEMRAGFVKYLQTFADKYPNFHVLKLFSTYPKKYMGDDIHLNVEGSQIWTDEVCKILNTANVPGGPFGQAADQTNK